jgi:hypothetical protein
MGNFNLQEDTKALIADALITDFDSKKYVDWAVRFLSDCYESENLYILAGLDGEDRETIEKYFGYAAQEFGVSIDIEPEELVKWYALYTAENVVSGQVSPDDGLLILIKIAHQTSYDERYLRFIYLTDDLYSLETGDIAYFHDKLALQNKDEYIREEIKLFLELERLNISNIITEYVYCNKCYRATKPVFKKGLLFTSVRCGNCNSKKIDSFYSQDGRQKIIEYVRDNKDYFSFLFL